MEAAINKGKPFINPSRKKITVCQSVLSPKPLLTVIGGVFSILRFLLCNMISFDFYPQNLQMMARGANAYARKLITTKNDRVNVLLLDDVANYEMLIGNVISRNKPPLPYHEVDEKI